MQYPLISEYVAAMRDARENLDQLRHLVPVLDNHGEPLRSSGAFAVVFKMKDGQTGRCYALKCFTEEQEGRAEAYRMISEELEMTDAPYLTTVRYLERELFVDSSCDDEEFPVLLMDWVEGETMERYVAAHYRDRHAMSLLCYRFCRLASWLRAQPFAHGDLKPDNIMVRPDGSLTLVDYDGMFVPSMKGRRSPTLGTKDFSHPQRTQDDFDETIDDFALASIALSLKAISLQPSLLDDYGAPDRLLFSAADYRDLAHSKVLAALQSLLADEELCTLYALFHLSFARKNLSQCSFRLFGIAKPKEEEVLNTEVTKEELENAVEDEYDVKYSKDGKRLLEAPCELRGEYVVRKGTKVICYDAFNRCDSLTHIELPSSLTHIGFFAFFGCDSLTHIELPSSLTHIEARAFGGCKSLTHIVLPSSVRELAGNPFARWYGSLEVQSKFLVYEDGVLFNRDKTVLISYCSKNRKYVVPKGVTHIGGHAFGSCSSLTHIELPSSLTHIGDWAFSDCKSLTHIALPSSLTHIGGHAFGSCSSLTHIELPSSLTHIGDEAFLFCNSLTEVIIPSSVTHMGKYAFPSNVKIHRK